uniref:Uncharacterized protein n=1 Tax=Arundo donax TaxID=35708 RepID=A0A0A9EFS4_ARUDO
MQGLSNEGPSPSDHIFASAPVPHSLVHDQVPVPTPYAAAMYHHVPMGVAVGMVPMNSGHHQNGYGHGDK